MFDIEKVEFNEADFDGIYENALIYAKKHAKTIEYSLAIVGYSAGLESSRLAMRGFFKLSQMEQDHD